MDIDSIERELQLELEKFEHIFQNSQTEMDGSPQNSSQWNNHYSSNSLGGSASNHSARYSSYEAAMAEADEEIRRDEPYAKRHGSEKEKEKLLVDAQAIIAELSARNDVLRKENETLKVRSPYFGNSRDNTNPKPKGREESAPNSSRKDTFNNSKAKPNDKENDSSHLISEAQAVAALTQLEAVLSETRSQFAAIQRELEIANENKIRLDRELSLEQLRRVAAEKERDAYAAAYETSLKHFEMWNAKKQQLRGGPGTAHS
jgi:hypothetical protein